MFIDYFYDVISSRNDGVKSKIDKLFSKFYEAFKAHEKSSEVKIATKVLSIRGYSSYENCLLYNRVRDLLFLGFKKKIQADFLISKFPIDKKVLKAICKCIKIEYTPVKHQLRKIIQSNVPCGDDLVLAILDVNVKNFNNGVDIDCLDDDKVKPGSNRLLTYKHERQRSVDVMLEKSLIEDKSVEEQAVPSCLKTSVIFKELLELSREYPNKLKDLSLKEFKWIHNNEPVIISNNSQILDTPIKQMEVSRTSSLAKSKLDEFRSISVPNKGKQLETEESIEIFSPKRDSMNIYFENEKLSMNKIFSFKKMNATQECEFENKRLIEPIRILYTSQPYDDDLPTPTMNVVTNSEGINNNGLSKPIELAQETSEQLKTPEKNNHLIKKLEESFLVPPILLGINDGSSASPLNQIVSPGSEQFIPPPPLNLFNLQKTDNKIDDIKLQKKASEIQSDSTFGISISNDTS